MQDRQEPRLKRLLDSINLSLVERVVRPHFKKWERGDGVPGRTPHNPVALVVTMLIQLVRQWGREDLIDFLAKHEEWRRWLRLKSVPDSGTWSHLLKRVPQATLNELLTDLVRDLHREGFLFLATLAGDGSFLPACGWDPEARWGYVRKDEKRATPVGRFHEDDGKILGYGWRIHALVDATAEVPIAVHVTPANVNDAPAFPDLMQTAQAVNWNRTRFLVLDSGYDDTTVRNALRPYEVDPVIHPKNLPPRVKAGGFKGGRRKAYRKRSAVERFFATLKSFFQMHHWGIVGLSRVRKWVTLAAIAVLIVAWVNHQAGRPKGSIKAFIRRLR